MVCEINIQRESRGVFLKKRLSELRNCFFWPKKHLYFLLKNALSDTIIRKGQLLYCVGGGTCKAFLRL
jgi:hypothetical protein